MIEIIQKMVANNIACDHLVVDGDGVHFELTVISKDFEGKNLVARHRMIYAALADKMQQEIHALSMKLYTPLEWVNINRNCIEKH